MQFYKGNDRKMTILRSFSYTSSIHIYLYIGIVFFLFVCCCFFFFGGGGGGGGAGVAQQDSVTSKFVL